MTNKSFSEQYGIVPCPRYGSDCRVYGGFDPETLTRWVQHGPNPEHRLVLEDRVMVAGEPIFREYAGQGSVIAEWVNRVHEYEKPTVAPPPMFCGPSRWYWGRRRCAQRQLEEGEDDEGG